MQPEEEIRRVIEFNEVLGDGVRLAIMLYLRIKGKVRFNELASGLGISSGRLAHHLGVLEGSGYIRVERLREDLRGRIIEITPEGVNALREYLSSMVSMARKLL
ncbi:MAG: transcriptional regulator [Candidatus Korarchaeum sp.]